MGHLQDPGRLHNCMMDLQDRSVVAWTLPSWKRRVTLLAPTRKHCQEAWPGPYGPHRSRPWPFLTRPVRDLMQPIQGTDNGGQQLINTELIQSPQPLPWETLLSSTVPCPKAFPRSIGCPDG